MPSLSTITDSTELDNRYIDKCVVYVEGEDDETVWRHVLGSDIADRLEFKVPLTTGSGHEVVCERVGQERASNPKIFGLLDGEVAAVFGRVDRLINSVSSEVIFELDIPKLDGILFVAEHEIENIFLRHSNLSAYIQSHTPISGIGRKDLASINEQLLSLARRFFVAALFKYASAHLRAGGAACAILNVNRFRSRESVLTVSRAMKEVVRSEGVVHPSDVMRELFSIARMHRERAKKEMMSAELRAEEILRLTEGKGFLAYIRHDFELHRTCDGHLVERLKESPYSSRFKEAICGGSGFLDSGIS